MHRFFSSVFIGTLLSLGTASAQTGHEGHDHSPMEKSSDGVSAIPENVEHVFTEAPDDHVIGSVVAPVSIIIYASVTCPHCADWFTHQWPTLKANHVDTGDVRVVFREFPTAPAQLAMAGFLLANCAPEDQFFANIEYQMQNQDAIFAAVQIGKGSEAYGKIAKMAGLEDEDAMNACFADPAGFDQIGHAMKRAEAGRIQGVPAFIIDGEIFKGDTSAAGLSSLISDKLSSGMTPIP